MLLQATLANKRLYIKVGRDFIGIIVERTLNIGAEHVICVLLENNPIGKPKPP